MKERGGGMAQGIVVKIWNVSAGSGTRSTSAQLTSSIQYIENPEKISGNIAINTVQQINNELSYVAEELKTMQGLYVGTRHIMDISNATNEMMQVKEFYGKLDGRIATHGIISLDEEESDIQNAGNLMLLMNDLMKSIFPDNQVVYAVHTNTENLHIHFILNTVGMDGKKIHMDKQFMRKVLEPEVNKLAAQYGFTPNTMWSQEVKRDQVPWATRKIELKMRLDDAIEQTDDIASLVAYLRAKGMTVNIGKQISVQLEGMAGAMKTGTLGADYTPDGIVRRMESKQLALVWKSIGEHAHYMSEREMMNFTPMKMKKYCDMTKEERKSAVRLLKLSRNPWEESRKDNWAVQSMSKQLNQVANVYEMVHFYSKGRDSTEAALKEILKHRTEIAEERKQLRKNLKEQKAVVAIYEEMKKYMVQAYLYDAYGRTEHVEAFATYKELTKRLEDIYGKTVEEVAAFVSNQNDQLVYAKAQDTELFNHYRTIKKYLTEGAFREESVGLSFYHAVGHGEAMRQAREDGILVSDMKYIMGEQEDVAIRVVTTPEVFEEKIGVETTITVMDHDGRELEHISSKELSGKVFNQEIFDIASRYGLKKCQVSKKNLQRNNVSNII